MKAEGNEFDGVEFGNAWDDLYCPGTPTNWIVGATDHIPSGSLRFMQQDNEEDETVGTKARNVAVKWFVHRPDDPAEWGSSKPISVGHTISLLAGDGEFELLFSNAGTQLKLTLDEPGDFAVWGPGLEHSWRPVKTSTIVTIRWQPEE